MARSYEYRFVRLGESGGSAFFGVQDKARNAYQEVVHEYARDGWRLVQIFAPGVAAFGAAKYYELIFERERTEGTTAATRAGRQRAFSVSAPQPGSRPGDPPGRAMASPGGGSDSRP